jgi:hypothetical protein
MGTEYSVSDRRQQIAYRAQMFSDGCKFHSLRPVQQLNGTLEPRHGLPWLVPRPLVAELGLLKNNYDRGHAAAFVVCLRIKAASDGYPPQICERGLRFGAHHRQNLRLYDVQCARVPFM